MGRAARTRRQRAEQRVAASGLSAALNRADALTKRVDEDRWLASRFAAPNIRWRLSALYAVNYEIARIAESVSEPALGDIRFAWWSEALRARGGAPRAHEALQAFDDAGLDGEIGANLQTIIATRRAHDLEREPFANLEALELYAEATAGVLIGIAARACGASLDEGLINTAGRAWGLIGAVRAAPFWNARGRTIIPAALTSEDLIARARDHYAQARHLASRAPAAAFPAFGYVALAPLYWRRLNVAPSGRLARQWRLVLASASGRI